MSKRKIKRSVIFPIIMLAWLAAMAWIGRDRLDRGEYLYYFGVIGVGLVIILLLYLSLRKKEQLQQRRREEQYGTYADDQDQDQEKEESSEKE